MMRVLDLLAYLGMVAGDVIWSSLQTAWIIAFRRNVSSALITVPIDLPSPAAITLLAATITLTPGTLTADIAPDGRSLTVHCLHAPDPDAIRDQIKARYERRLQRIFR